MICNRYFNPISAKKQFSVVMALLFLISNLGLAFKIHFCKDKIESIGVETIFASQEKVDTCCDKKQETKSCCKKIKTPKKGCCTNKIIKTKKAVDTYFSTNYDFGFVAVFILNSDLKFNLVNPVFCAKNQIKSYSCKAHAPPIFELNCQRLFYA